MRDIDGAILKLSLYICHHDFTTRGLLCKSCSLGFSLFRDNALLLARAIAFLSTPVVTDAEVRIGN
jgi:hypothetical protein